MINIKQMLNDLKIKTFAFKEKEKIFIDAKMMIENLPTKNMTVSEIRSYIKSIDNLEKICEISLENEITKSKLED